MEEITGRDFGRLEGTVNQILEAIQSHAQDDNDWHEAINKEIADLKTSRDISKGKTIVWAGIASLGGGGIVASVLAYLGNHLR